MNFKNADVTQRKKENQVSIIVRDFKNVIF